MSIFKHIGLVAMVACGPGPEGPAPEPPQPQGPEVGEPSETHYVVQYAHDGSPAADVSLVQSGGGVREEHRPDPRGLVPRPETPRHVEVRDADGRVLYRGPPPEDGRLEVPPPLRVEGNVAPFGEGRSVLIGHGYDVPLSSHFWRLHGIPRPWTTEEEFEDPVPRRWTAVEVGPDGSFSSDVVIPDDALAIVVTDASGAFEARDLDPESAEGLRLTLAEPMSPAQLGTLRLSLPPDPPGGPWFVRIEPAHDVDAPQRRAAALIAGADVEHGRLLTGRKAVPIASEPTDLARIPTGPWTISLFEQGADPAFRASVDIGSGAPTTWQPTSEEVAQARPEPVQTVMTLPDTCKNADNWSSIGEYTGIPDGAAFVPILGMFALDTSALRWKTFSDTLNKTSQAWTVPSMKTLRCSSSDCKTIATVAINQLPSWTSNIVRGSVMYSPWLMGMSAETRTNNGENYQFAAAVNTGMKGSVVERLRVYVLDSAGKAAPVGTSVAFPSTLDGSSPAYGAVGSDGYVLVRNASGSETPIYCANTVKNPLGGMTVVVTFNEEDIQGTCTDYLGTSGDNACVIVAVASDGKSLVCNPSGSSCTP